MNIPSSTAGTAPVSPRVAATIAYQTADSPIYSRFFRKNITLFCALACAALYAGEARAASPPGDVVGKITVGYQGWFSAAGDGSPVNAWGHSNLEMA